MQWRIFPILFLTWASLPALAQQPLNSTNPDLQELLPFQDTAFIKKHKIKSMTCYADAEWNGKTTADHFLLLSYRYGENGVCIGRCTREYMYHNDSLWSMNESKFLTYRFLLDSIVYNSNNYVPYTNGKEWGNYYITRLMNDTLYAEESGSYTRDTIVTSDAYVRNRNEERRAMLAINKEAEPRIIRLERRYEMEHCNPYDINDSLGRKSKKMFYRHGYHRPMCGNDNGVHCEMAYYYAYTYEGTSSILTSFSVVDTIYPSLNNTYLTVQPTDYYVVLRNGKVKTKKQAKPKPAPVEKTPPYIHFRTDLLEHSPEGIPTLIQTQFYNEPGAKRMYEKRNYRIVLEYYP